MSRSKVEPIGILFENGELCLVIPETDFVEGSTFFGTEFAVTLTAKP